MALGPGKYDDACTYVRKRHRARGVIVIVMDGDHGDGFSCQTPPDLMAQIPRKLALIAATISRDIGKDLRDIIDILEGSGTLQ